MTKEDYMESHHHIRESYIGLIRVRLDDGDLETAKYFADKCAEEIGKLCKLYENNWSV